MWTIALIVAAACLYAGALAAYVVWVRARWPRPWWLKAVAPLAMWLFGPSVVLPLAGPLVNRPLYWVAAAVACALYLGHFALPMCRHRRAGSTRSEPVVRVMTANLYKRNARHAEIIQSILSEDPDIVALQELNHGQARALAAGLSAHYPFQMLHPGTDAEGMGLLSRYPLAESELDPGSLGANPLLLARVRLPEDELTVINVHPRIPRLETARVMGMLIPSGLDTREREADARHIASRLNGSTEAVLLLRNCGGVWHRC